MDQRPSIRKIGSVRFLRLRGNAVERARQHGELLREQIQDSALIALSKKNEWVIRRAPGATQFKPVADFVVSFYRNVLLPRLSAQMSAHEREIVREFAKAAGVSEKLCMESVFQADGIMLLARISLMKYLLPQFLPAGSMPGCTSAVTLPHWNQSGRLLACRNQDYFIVGPWERNTAVMFHEPVLGPGADDPHEIPHVSITTAGVHTSGLTSMNREGICVFTHAHFGRTISLSGRPVVAIADEIARKAKTLAQAIDIARKARTLANWSYVVASARENEAIVIEKTPRKTIIRSTQDGFIAHSNFFHTPELRSEEALLSGSYCEDLVGRVCGIRQLLEEYRGQLEPAHMTKAISDQRDFYSGDERCFGNTLGVVTTVKSTVFDPLVQKFWIADREESPVGLGRYLEIDADKFWNQSFDERSSGTWPSLAGYQPKDPALVEGLRHYREAYQAWHVENEKPDFAERTFAATLRAIHAYPKDGHLWVQAGIVAFKLKRFDDARKHLEESRTRPMSKHTSGVRDLFLARCYDIAGRRDEALTLYKTYQTFDEPKLKRALRGGLRKKYRPTETWRMVLDMQFPDTFEY